MIVFDVGANKGEFSQHILRHNSTAQVFAFEPNFSVCGTSLERLKNNYPERLQVNYLALGTKSGSGELFGSQVMNGQLGSLIPFNAESEGWSSHSKIMSGIDSVTHSEIVKVLAVSELAESWDKKPIDFIKIDTQGTDVQILTEFLKFFHIISGVIEVDAGNYPEGYRYRTNHNGVEDLVFILSKYGFQVTKILPNNSRSDELNVYFSSSQKIFEETTTTLKLASNPVLARYWVIQGIGTLDNENTQVLFRRFIKKVFRAFVHPKSSLRSVLLKLTK